MNKFNDSLYKSLNLLYEYSRNFQISIELIQKLAQHLNLETYIDTSTNRLTIAGSSILLDIDFKNTNKVTNVSLSSESNGFIGNGQDYMSVEKDIHGFTVIKLNSNNSPLKFMEKSEDKSVVERILFDNLSQARLGEFPVNLQYLASIDKFPNSIQDIEKTALIFYTIYKSELEKQPNNWQIIQGLSNKIGLVKFHDVVQGKLGLFLEFWQDFRFINHESETVFGNKYNILFTIVGSDTKYSDKTWEIGSERFKFEFDQGLSMPWQFNLVLNHSIYIPTYLVEYLGLDEYTTENHSMKKLYEQINSGQEVVDSLNILGKTVSCLLVHNLPLTYIPLKTLKLYQISDIIQIIPILRNFLVLTNLYRNLLKENNNCIIRRTSRRRSTRVSINKELTEEVRQKLKDSLKLPDDVTDEELLGLNAISETANYSTIQPVNTLDLNSFMNNEQTNASKENYFQLSVDDIVDNEVYLTIEAYSDIKEIFIKFKISNGEIKLMDDDINEYNSKFIKVLELTEDFMVAITSVY